MTTGNTETTWTEVCKFILKTAAGDIVSALVDALVKAIGQEENDIASLKQDIRRLIEAPLKTGKTFLEDADRQSSEIRKKDLIEDARRELTRASNIDSPLAAAEAALLVSGCYHLLGEAKNAAAWAEKAYTTADTWAEELHRIADQSTYQTKEDDELEQVYAFMRPLSDMLYAKQSTLSNLKSSAQLVCQQKPTWEPPNYSGMGPMALPGA